MSHPSELQKLIDAMLGKPTTEDDETDRLAKRLDALIIDQAVWSIATFGSYEERGPVGALRHLAKECDEAIADPLDIDEYADCFILLIDAAGRSGHFERSAFAELISSLSAASVEIVKASPCGLPRTPADRAAAALHFLKGNAQAAAIIPEHRAYYVTLPGHLFGAAVNAGYTVEDIVEAAERKMIVNKARKWPKPEADTPVEHVRDETAASS